MRSRGACWRRRHRERVNTEDHRPEQDTPAEMAEASSEPAEHTSDGDRATSLKPPRLALLARHWSYNELPAWPKLLRMLHVYDDERWTEAGEHVGRGKLDGYFHKLDLSDPDQRETYFLAVITTSRHSCS